MDAGRLQALTADLKADRAGTAPKRILFVHTCQGIGGAPLSLLYLIEKLDRSRFAPEILLLGRGGDEVDLFRRQGIPVYLRSDITVYPHARGAHLRLRSLRPWEIVTLALRGLPSMVRMRAFVKSRRVDLVHLNTIVLIPSALGTWLAGVPLVWHIRETLYPGLFGARARIVREIIRRCSRMIIGISHVNAEPWVGEPHIRVVYNFVDFQRFDRALSGRPFRERERIPANRPVIAMLGGVVHSKGADVLVEAAHLVRARRPDAMFVIAGYPPTGRESPSRFKRILRRTAEWSGLLPNVERRIIDRLRALGLEDSVRFVGLRSDVPDLLAACEMLVWPATVSHFSRPVIEAGAMAKPVVASDWPSSRELVESGVTGLLVPPSEPRPLAEAILRLLERPDEGRAMGERGHALARERYDASRNVAAIMTIYDSVFLERRKPGEGM